MTNWVKILDTGPNDPSYKCSVRILWIRTGMEWISALLCNPNPGHDMDGTAVSNKINGFLLCAALDIRYLLDTASNIHYLLDAAFDLF
jgi:hypothetical protein